MVKYIDLGSVEKKRRFLRKNLLRVEGKNCDINIVPQ